LISEAELARLAAKMKVKRAERQAVAK